MDFAHRPVMVRETLHFLNCRSGGVYVDGTVGGGGHAVEILNASAPDGVLIGIDRDTDALRAARKRLAPYGRRAILVKEDFGDLGGVLKRVNLKAVDGILLDLGVSLYQLLAGERGFSFRFDARLDMRMDRMQELSAYDLVNNLGVKELSAIIRRYGEERFALRIARAIERKRQEKPVETTEELSAIVYSAIPKKFHSRKIHPATKTFQALRIVVNNELEVLEKGLAVGLDALVPGGRFVVISYHSLEDRIVKHAFRQAARGCTCPPDLPSCVCGKTPVVRVLTRRVVTPGPGEIEENPRARSARLRAVEKL